jgi:hypothetical protein
MREVTSTTEEPMVCTTLRWREMDSNYWYRGTKSPLPKFPASTEYTGEFHSIGAQLRTPRQKIVRYASASRANSLRIRTGNFSSPCRELNQAITEFFGRIREQGAAIAALAS